MRYNSHSKEEAMARSHPEQPPITVVLPPGPPKLTPGAASVLLRILLKAYEEQTRQETAVTEPATPVPPAE